MVAPHENRAHTFRYMDVKSNALPLNRAATLPQLGIIVLIFITHHLLLRIKRCFWGGLGQYFLLVVQACF